MTPIPDPSDDHERQQELQVKTALFALLLKGFSVFHSRSRPSEKLSLRFSNVLEQFGEISQRVSAAERLRFRDQCVMFDGLLKDYATAWETYRRNQENSADDFNLLDVVQITFKEIRHSMVLAWLLDHDMRNYGTHAQGVLGFRLFLEQAKLPASYADCRYAVRREVGGEESIVDVEISSPGQFLIHIENKIHATEGQDQTTREWADVERRAAELGLSTAAVDGQVHAIYLTPHGAQPTCKFFGKLKWGKVADALSHFAEQAKPPDVKLFAAHYARALRRFVLGQGTMDEKGMYAEGTAE